MNKTYMANAQTIERKWYVIDATDLVLGRLSTEAASLLKGKLKPIWTPHVGLRVGGSTGGTDIISQAYSFKTRTSFISISFYINFVIIVLGGILNGLEAAAYTIIYLIISVTVLGKVFTTYKFMRVTIVTEEKGRLKEELLKHFNHGITIYQAVGAYSNTPKYVLETIVSDGNPNSCYSWNNRQ